MFSRFFKKPLSIKIDDRTLQFDSKIDFEFALASRTEVPSAKISELVRFTAQQLLDEGSSVRQVERHFVETLSRSLQEPGSIGYLLREMDMKMFSQDHEWRAIMQGLAQQQRQFDDYKQLALVKYMQYLASRQDVLKGIYTHKVSGGQSQELETDSMQEPQFRQTLIFDVSESPLPSPPANNASPAAPGVAPPQLVRLPRGESVTVDISASNSDQIVLSRHPFTLRLGESPALIDDRGDEQPLRPGRNVLGRHPDSDVMIDATHRDVSRTHAIIELLENGVLRITDLSSHGTFVAAEALVTN
jgi:hypothetical protein